MTFQFDTSGRVQIDGAPFQGATLSWENLSPFVQGYGAAMAQVLYERLINEALALRTPLAPEDAAEAVAFRNWVPETLARIMEDCERFKADPGASWLIQACSAGGVWGDGGMRNAGDAFWRTRNDMEHDFTFAQRTGRGSDWPNMSAGSLQAAAKRFPPLTPYLGEDGKVCLREDNADA